MRGTEKTRIKKVKWSTVAKILWLAIDLHVWTPTYPLPPLLSVVLSFIYIVKSTLPTYELKWKDILKIIFSNILLISALLCTPLLRYMWSPPYFIFTLLYYSN